MKSLKELIEEILLEDPSSTKKYDDAPELTGGQDELPDHLQKAIIKKAKGQKK